MSLVLLKWIDSASSEGWQPLKDYEHGPIYVQSVGWIIREDDVLITIASHIGRQAEGEEPNQGCGWMSIPKACIRERQTITL